MVMYTKTVCFRDADFFFIFKANLGHGGLRDIKRARVASSIQWNFKFYFTTCEKVPEIRFFECLNIFVVVFCFCSEYADYDLIRL